MPRPRDSSPSHDLLPPMGGDGPPPVHLLGYLLNRLTARVNQRWLEELRPYKLTVPRWQVLSILATFDGSRVGQLAEMSGQEQPVVSRLIDQMQRDGLVERRRAGEGRGVHVWLLEPGHRLLQALAPAAERFVGQLVAPLSIAEQQMLMALLVRLHEGLDTD